MYLKHVILALACPSGCTLVEPSLIAGWSGGQSIVLLIISVCSSVTRLSKYSHLRPFASVDEEPSFCF